MTPSQWLSHLQQQSMHHGLTHIDLLIDTCGLAQPLDPLPTDIARARLLDPTPERAIAHQGPQLLRLFWHEPRQYDWLQSCLVRLHGSPRSVAVLSEWSFSELATHLSLCTQASWNQGTHGGLLRYWDPRLLLACHEMLTSAQAAWFHAPFAAWHWLDRDGQPAELLGHPRHPAEMPDALDGISLSNEQVAELITWTDAEALRMASYIQPHQYGLPNQEALIRHLMHAQRAANHEGLFDPDQRSHYLHDWLARHSAISPAKEEIA